MFLTHYFPPEVNAPASRTMEHARVWVREGHEVTVVTCAPSHPAGRVYPGYRNRLWQTETIDGVRVIRLWTMLSANAGFLRRSLNFLSYFAMATLAAPFLPRPDVVVSTSPQFFCGLAGYPVSRIKRRRWVLEIRDLWPESILAVGAARDGLLVRLLQRAADWAYRKADHVIVLTDAFKAHIARRGVAHDRLSVIKNGVDLGRFSPGHADVSLKRRLGAEGKFVAAYVGTHGAAHRLETALEAARLLERRKDIVFLLVGDGAERARLAALKDEMKLSNVIMLGQQPKSAMVSVWGAADVCLALLRKDEVFKTVIPSKMFEAMAMRRPVILAVEGEARELLDAAGAGIGVAPENAFELAAAVERLAGDPALAARLGARGAAFVREQFDRSELARRYLKLLGGVCCKDGVGDAEARALAG